MGVTVLQQFPMTENRTGPQTIEFLTKRVVALGATQTGQFLVDCETYQSVPQLGVPFSNINNSLEQLNNDQVLLILEESRAELCLFSETHQEAEALCSLL